MTEVPLPTPVDRRRAFSASNAARFIACHASADLAGALPGWIPPVRDPTKGQKGVGTEMHTMLEKAALLPLADLRALMKALEYYESVRSRRRFNVLTEHSTQADWLKTKPRTTVDVVLYVQDELHIMDWKWGKIFVDVLDNEQLLFYAACHLAFAPKAKEVHLHIVQPLIDNMEEWVVSAAELEAFMLKAQAAEAAIEAGDHTFGVSDHCTFCPAYPHSRGDKGNVMCPAAMKLLYPPKVDEQAILDL